MSKDLRFIFWLALRLLLTQNRRLLSVTGWVSLAGLILGVACLVVSMAVISGFEATLMKSVSDVAGHIQIFRLQSESEPWETLMEKLRRAEPSILAGNRFAMIEGVLAYQGRISGVFVQGVDQDEVRKVLGLQDRIIAGKFSLAAENEVSQVLIGKGLARDFQLKPGDEFRVIVPLHHDLEVTKFHRKVGLFRVAGILDLGKYEYDQRWIFSSLQSAQVLADIGNRYSGVQLKLEDPARAREAAIKISSSLGPDYRVRDWRDINENLFEAVKIEKVVIFFVIFVIIIAAAFNVASSLYVKVIQSFQQIGMLKALGLQQKKLVQVFCIQGLILGAVGSCLGFILGLFFSLGFLFLQKKFSLIQGGVYKLDFIYVQIRATDLAATLFATMLICLLATLAPALRGARLTTIEGIRSE